MGRWSCLLAFGLLACDAAEANITLKFATAEARDRTRLVAFTAFEPILAQPDEDRVPRFVRCDDIGVFPPTRLLDPDTIATEPNLAGVVSERTTQTFPLDDDWQVDVNTDRFNEELNPWGALMVFIEARGDAAAPASRGGGQVSTTLLSGCFCIRTQDGSHPDPTLDQTVKEACTPAGNDGSVPDREVVLGPVASAPFRLEACQNNTRLAAPRNELLSPGPSVCVNTTRCDASVQGPCFACEQPCGELDDRSNVPIRFDIFRGDSPSPEQTQIVLTDGDARADAQIEVDDCAQPLRVDAQIVGREGEAVSFEVDCIDTVDRFDCPLEVLLVRDFQPRALARVPRDPVACVADPAACDFVAVLAENGLDTILSVYDANTGALVTSRSYPGELGRAMVGYLYELARPGRTATRPVLAVLTAKSNGFARIRVLEWDSTNRTLRPHDGADGILEAPCRESICGSLEECQTDEQCVSSREVCAAGICQTDRGPPSPFCSSPAPVYCACEQFVGGGSVRVALQARDVDGDGLADLVSSTDTGVNLHFYYSSRAEQGELYRDECVCGFFGITPTALGLLTFGGDTPALKETDLLLGSNSGLFVNYARSPSAGLARALQCGQSTPMGDITATRDIQVAPLRCPIGDLGCVAHEDAVTVSARAVAGGSFDDPGAVTVLGGSAEVLRVGETLSGFRQSLVPRVRPGEQARPQDPQRAQLGDFNGDGLRDLAVLYSDGAAVRVWLGAGNGGFGEIEGGISLDQCRVSGNAECVPLPDFIAFDGDGDGRDELGVVCSPSLQPRLRIYTPRAP